jgi:hypothetical protein
MSDMSWLRRAAERMKPSRGMPAPGRGQSRIDDAVTMHLSEFVRTRRGVEAFVEPKTTVSQTTILLVAYDGEWTRRAVPSSQWAYAFAEHLQIPGYDAAVVGYPQRMRDYNSRSKKRANKPEWPRAPGS